MRNLSGIIASALVASLAWSAPASAENREEYLERLGEICSVECMIPRDLVRAARKRDKDDSSDMAVMMDIFDVTRWNDKYLLYANAWTNFLAAPRTPLSLRPELIPDSIVIELDEPTFFDILDVPAPGNAASGEPYIDREGNIIVRRDRDMHFSRPTLRKLRSMFRNRRVLARGVPRLVIGFVGGRRDFKNKKVFLQ
ncbi:MAG: hypothetical protein AAGH60_15940, partial [Pseudomonadota bacterium]